MKEERAWWFIVLFLVRATDSVGFGSILERQNYSAWASIGHKFMSDVPCNCYQKITAGSLYGEL